MSNEENRSKRGGAIEDKISNSNYCMAAIVYARW